MTTPDTLVDLDDIAVLAVDARDMGDPMTWAWDTHDETPGLLCLVCGHLGDADDPADADTCTGWDEAPNGREYPCQTTDTRRVITRIVSVTSNRFEVVRPADLA